MIRIGSGRLRGRLLKTASVEILKPTRTRVRMAIINSLQAELDGAKCLDLFSGSGAFGLEAISRGAESVLMVENNRAVLKALEENVRTLDTDSQCKVLALELAKGGKVPSLIRIQGPYDIVFADPPFPQKWSLDLIENWPWNDLLNPEGLFVLEWSRQIEDSMPEETPFLVKVREKTYGEGVVTHYRRKS